MSWWVRLYDDINRDARLLSCSPVARTIYFQLLPELDASGALPPVDGVALVENISLIVRLPADLVDTALTNELLPRRLFEVADGVLRTSKFARRQARSTPPPEAPAPSQPPAPLSNAERQKRYRQRSQAAVTGAVDRNGDRNGGVTPGVTETVTAGVTDRNGDRNGRVTSRASDSVSGVWEPPEKRREEERREDQPTDPPDARDRNGDRNGDRNAGRNGAVTATVTDCPVTPVTDPGPIGGSDGRSVGSFNPPPEADSEPDPPLHVRVMALLERTSRGMIQVGLRLEAEKAFAALLLAEDWEPEVFELVGRCAAAGGLTRYKGPLALAALMGSAKEDYPARGLKTVVGMSREWEQAQQRVSARPPVNGTGALANLKRMHADAAVSSKPLATAADVAALREKLGGFGQVPK